MQIFISHFIFRRQPAEFFFQKNSSNESSKCDFIKTLCRFGLTWNAEIIVVQDEFFDIADFVESFAANFLDAIITKINNLE